MKAIVRGQLSPKTSAFLAKRTAAVTASPDPFGEAGRLWRQQKNRAFREIREHLDRMATGIARCMYCEDSEGSGIDHFWPRNGHPYRAFDWLNYLLACSICNSNSKRDQFPLDQSGQPLLVDPTAEDPLDHLTLTSPGVIRATTEKGRRSIEIFRLDRKKLERGRQRAWQALGIFITRYAQAMRDQDDDQAHQITELVRDYPFASVLAHLLRAAGSPHASALVDTRVLAVLKSHPEIFNWV
jgi:uncharacterized protein (TIGR02646 family)